MTELLFRVAREFDVVKIRRTKEAEEHIVLCQKEGKCLGCEEPLVEGERVTRGACGTCYNGMMHLISIGKVQEKDLMRDGKLLQPSKGGRKPANDFLKSLAEAAK